MPQSSAYNAKVGLVGLYACGNAGDEAILRCVAQLIQDLQLPVNLYSLAIGPAGFCKTFLPNDVDPMSAAPCYHTPYRMIPNNRKISWKRLLIDKDHAKAAEAAREMDVVLWAGGYAIHDRRPAVMPTVAYLARNCFRGNGKFGFFCVGAGPLNTLLGQSLMCWIADRSAMISVRDDQSRHTLQQAGIQADIHTAVDPAVLLRSSPKPRIQDLLRTSGINPQQPYVTICPCAWYSIEEYYSRNPRARQTVIDTLSQTARHLVLDEGLQVLFVPTMWPEDGQVSQEICETLNMDAVRSIDQQLIAPDVQGLIEHSKALISMRMHPLVFAFNTRVPFVAIAHDRKIQTFLSQINASQNCIALQDFNVDEIIGRFRRCVWGNANDTHDLARQHEDHRQTLNKAATTLKRVLDDVVEYRRSVSAHPQAIGV